MQGNLNVNLKWQLDLLSLECMLTQNLLVSTINTRGFNHQLSQINPVFSQINPVFSQINPVFLR